MPIKRSEIPQYLRFGGFYLSLLGGNAIKEQGDTSENDEELDNFNKENEENDEQELLPVPEKCMKMDTSVQNEQDLIHLLNTLRYWLIVDIPKDLIVYSLQPKNKQILEAACTQFELEITSLVVLRKIVQASVYVKMLIAAEHGLLDAIAVLHSEYKLPLTARACEVAAEHGQLECLRFLHSLNCPWDCGTCICAAQYHQLSCLEFALRHGCEGSREVCEVAARMGHVDCLRVAHELCCPWDSRTCEEAAFQGHLPCLQFAFEHSCVWDQSLLNCTVSRGHLNCVKYMCEKGLRPDVDTCEQAAVNGKLDCLKYLRERGAPWRTDYMCTNAATSGNVACLQYVHSEGCDCDLRRSSQAGALRLLEICTRAACIVQ